MKTLLIIDVQNDFLPGGSLPVAGSDVIVPIINRLQARFDLVVAAQDWHPQNHASFASNHPGRAPFDAIELNGLAQTLWPDHCVQGSRGAAFASALDMRRVEAIFRKGCDPAIDSYSAFFDNGHRKTTGLADYLRGKGTTELSLCGLAGDICVHFSALDAVQAGFAVHFIRDAATPLDPVAAVARLDELHQQGVRILDSDQIG
ncbi:MAG TPA: bifunctional nicotinamidase/pyrazinamidase [Rhodanobacteraceae bacterium]|nr:bifunctional nicotinamidase/pyrazinamidase [Rhodanobacteraceae bacterium]